jgi:hypothetical protein
MLTLRRTAGLLPVLACAALAAGCASSAAPVGAASPAGPAGPAGAADSAPTTTSDPASGTAPDRAPAGESAPQAPECAEGQLAFRVSDAVGAAAGTRYSDVVLTNTARSACWLRGSASVVPLDARRQVVQVALEGPGSPGSRVVLDPGGSASEVFGYGTDGNPAPGQAACGPQEDYLEVTLPGTAHGVDVSGWHGEKCEADVIVTYNLVSGDSARP